MSKKKQPKADKENFLAIDENELDKEWQEQPSLYYKWSRKLAKARLRLDEAKSNLELVYADLDAEIRAKPKKYKLGEKVTEAAVKQCILVQEEYTDAVSKLNQCRYRVNVLEAGVTALEHRKRALEKAVDLLAMDHWAEPRTSNEKGREAKRKLDKRSARASYRSDD
jgi:hypothetical protein